jgi:predicted choloylglycine hydrolase
MSTDEAGRLGYLEISGSHYDIGVQLGRFGREIAHRHLVTTHAWATVMARRNDGAVTRMREMAAARFPAYWQELTGLSEGLGLPFDEVFLWNCRGDIWALAPDGCTTVQIPGDGPIVAHNEDGDPGFRGHCALAYVRPAAGKAFCAFVYPASIPGHAFAVTEAGLVQAVNNIRSRDAGAGLPRMLLGRAVLDCDTLDDAIRFLQTAERAGAFHVTLARRGDPRLLGIEFTHARCSILTLEQTSCHANHLVHPDMSGERQVITGSSRSRQQRGDAVIANASAGRLDPLSVLWDRGHLTLPVYRAQSDDPDHENTLATAVLRVGAASIAWDVYDRAGAPPRLAFRDLERQDGPLAVGHRPHDAHS